MTSSQRRIKKKIIFFKKHINKLITIKYNYNFYNSSYPHTNNNVRNVIGILSDVNKNNIIMNISCKIRVITINKIIIHTKDELIRWRLLYGLL